MLKKLAVPVLLLLPLPLTAAGDYPTVETVRMVVTCMAELGAQNEENLLTCSCRQDALAARISFDDYEQGTLFETHVRMPGKRGNLFRDSDMGRDYIKQLTAARQAAADECPLVRKVPR